MRPKVSCICPTRGRFETLRQAISFFLLQDYSNKELIIFNNCEINLNPHPKLIKHNIKVINAGSYLGKSMESVYADTLKHVSEDSEYIAVWDDDDFYFPWHLSYNIEKLQNSDKVAIRSSFGYWQDIHNSTKDHYTIVQNTLEASMIAKKGVIFFPENNTDPQNSGFTHPHTEWVSKAARENLFEYNSEDITACFRWGYGKSYHHLQSVGPHKNNEEHGNGEFLRPCSVKHLFYDVLEKANLTIKDKKIVCFDSQTKLDFYKKIITHGIDKFDHIDKFNVWLYWNSKESPDFIRMCHESISNNTFANVVIVNDETIHQYNLPQKVMNFPPVQKSDYLRVHLLYHHGGWWFDSDTYVVGDLDEHYFRFLDQHDNVFPWEYDIPGNMTTPIFSSKPYTLVIREAYNNLQNYIDSDPNIGWSGIGVNGIMKAVETYKHRGEGYYFGLPSIAKFGYNNGEIHNWNFNEIDHKKLQMIIFHWSQIGAELSWKINGSFENYEDNLIMTYPNLADLFKKQRYSYL